MRHGGTGLAPRILMLIPHEPEEDPRIRWVADLCARVGRTDILGTTSSTEKQAREYDGVVYVERVHIGEQASGWARGLSAVLGPLYGLGPTRRYVARQGRLPAASLVGRLDHRLGAGLRFVSGWGWYAVIMSALYRRARATSIAPRVIVAHDLYALIPGVLLKRMHGCPLIYDSHEFWPQADLIGQAWEARLLARLERAAIRHADVVVTVSPPLAHHLASLYRHPRVVSVPNAEPFREQVVPSCARPVGRPVRFLFQGRVAPGRGIEAFLDAWRRLEDPRAVLWLRCPEDPYLAQLRAQFADAIRRGRLVVLPSVREGELVARAAEADVGVIPYVGPNLNHVYACPNKLSQYMHAGLAILSNRLEYITELIGQHRCGVTYDARDPNDLLARVQAMVSDLDALQRMKQSAYEAVRSEFNWEVQSRPYEAVIRELYERGCAA